jgi:UDP-N-acetylmuramate dehydrogenase
MIANKPLSEVCTFGIGGPARYFIEIKDIPAMQEVLLFCTKERLRFFILGKGSNCLFSDAGFDGVVIANKIDFCKEENGLFYVGAGYNFSLLGVQTARKGYEGLEFASGIPATVGGAVYMNAGAQGGETKDSLLSVDYVFEDGTLKRFIKDELQFSYRHSSFQLMKGAIVAASFQLTPSSEARQKQLTLLDYRIATQPYGEKSAGCVFRNPIGASAGALIDKCGLKGFTVGGAEVSTVHGNFLINGSQATAQDMQALIAEVQRQVKEKTGYDLEPEVRIIQ